jgi:thiamine kinase-like enzyme
MNQNGSQYAKRTEKVRAMNSEEIAEAKAELRDVKVLSLDWRYRVGPRLIAEIERLQQTVERFNRAMAAQDEVLSQWKSDYAELEAENKRKTDALKEIIERAEDCKDAGCAVSEDTLMLCHHIAHAALQENTDEDND